MVGESSEIIPKLAGPFDLVFMDHNKDEYLVDLWRIEDKGLLGPGSTIVADNVGPLFDARSYLKYVRTNLYNPYRSHYVECGLKYHEEHPYGMEISVWLGARRNNAPIIGVG